MAENNTALGLAVLALGGSGSSGVESVNGKTGTVTLYGTDINMSTDPSLPSVTEQISSNKTNISALATQIGGKQDALTAGTGIDITSNVISTDDVVMTTSQQLTSSEQTQVRSNLDLYYEYTVAAGTITWDGTVGTRAHATATRQLL